MPFDPISGIFTRIWKFVDQFAADDEVRRADLDTALDDFTPAINAALAAQVQADEATRYAGRGFPTSAALAADLTLTYATGVPGSVAANDIVQVYATGERYKVLDSGASSVDIATAGGVKLEYVPLAKEARTAVCFASIADLLADSTLGYAPAPLGPIDPGTFIFTVSDLGIFEVAPADATTHTDTTAGGLKLFRRNKGLTTISAIGSAANRIAYTSASYEWAEAPISDFALGLLDDASAASMRETIEAMRGVNTDATDWNDAIAPGTYTGGISAANAPSANVFYALTTGDDDANYAQLLLQRDGSHMYFRGNAGVTPSGWRDVIHSGMAEGRPNGSFPYRGPDGVVAWNGRLGPHVVLEEQQASGTAGGTFTSGANQTRTLNTEAYDVYGICALNTNQFTLPAGTYAIEFDAPAGAVGAHQAFLWDVTNSATVFRGSSAAASTPSCGFGVVTIAEETTFEIRHQCTTTRATDGFGVAASFGGEVFTRVRIWRVS